MKKTSITAIVILIFTLLTGCGGETKQSHTFDYEKQEPVTITINDEKK